MLDFLRLVWSYITLPLTLLRDIVLKPLGQWIGQSWQTFMLWLTGTWVWFLGILPNLLPVALGLLVLVVTILELVGEGWLLRRSAQIKNPWLRRAYVTMITMVFYVIACVQMAVVSIMFGLGVQWWLWIVITVLHLVGWALNTVLRAPFAWFWNGVRTLRVFLTNLVLDRVSSLKKVVSEGDVYAKPNGRNLGKKVKVGQSVRIYKVISTGTIAWAKIDLFRNDWIKAHHAQ